MSGAGASIRCDGPGCPEIARSSTLSETELRLSLINEYGWVTDAEKDLDACPSEECQDRIVGMVL